MTEDPEDNLQLALALEVNRTQDPKASGTGVQ